MLSRRATQRPQRVLQAFRQSHEALAAQHDMGMLEARERQAEVVEPMIERGAGDRDAEIARVGEVGEAHPAGRMFLAEDHLTFGAMERAPPPDAPLQRAPQALGEIRVAATDLFEHRDRTQRRRRDEHRHDLLVPDAGQRIGAPAPARPFLLRGKPRVFLHAVGRGRAEAGFGRRDDDGVGFPELHVEPHLAVGDMSAGQRSILPQGKVEVVRPAAFARRALQTRAAPGGA